MYEITNRLAPPYSAISYIRSDWADGTATRASGVVIGGNDVLTALHVVYDAERGGWASKVTIIPAADTQPWSKPFGEFTNVGSMVGRASNWDFNGDGYLTQAESAGDIALIGMRSPIADVTGWLPAVQAPNDFDGVMAGYPARGTGLMAEAVFADASSGYSVYNIQSALGGGGSGGPLLQTVNGIASVVGVLSGGDVANTYSTYGGLFAGATWDWLQSAMWANDNLLAGNGPRSVSTATGTSFVGSSAVDVSGGSAGWDTLTGNGGNDVLDGSLGTDTAVFRGSRGAYAVTLGSGSFTVNDSVAGRDGMDSLRNVERVKFADLSLAFDTGGNAGAAYRLYDTVFNRSPDAAGLGFHMKSLDSGASLAQVAASFILSAEFLSSGNLTDAQFVNQLYLYGLNRPVDAGGFAFHTASLAAGVSRADVVVGFSESPENQAALIGVMQNGMTYIA